MAQDQYQTVVGNTDVPCISVAIFYAVVSIMCSDVKSLLFASSCQELCVCKLTCKSD